LWGIGVQICPKCGQAFDGDKCWVCVARLIDIKETSIHCLIVACVGLLALGAASSYSPLSRYFPGRFLLLAAFVVPGVVAFLLVSFDRLSRYALAFRLTLILAAATPIMSAAFIYLNGAWDREPSVVTQAFVTHKFYELGRGGPAYFLDVTLDWQQQRRMDGEVLVDRKVYDSVEPSESVNVTVHPGQFSMPWYSDVFLPNGQDAIDLGRRSQ
jgi:hypothetical protein